MTTTEMLDAEDYISRVDQMPRATPMRAQIAMELRAHIAERLEHGHTLGEVLLQLGDPASLADSYLSANPLDAAPFADRVVAKLIDVCVVLTVVAPLAGVCAWLQPQFPIVTLVIVVLAVCGSLGLCLYTVAAEFRSGQTLGKRIRGLHVVRETGRRIGFGQAIVRQLGLIFSIYWVDALFSLFTDKHQRAFELLSKTRVVLASPREVI